MRVVYEKCHSGITCHLVKDNGSVFALSNGYSATGYGKNRVEARADLLRCVNFNLEDSYRRDMKALHEAVRLA